jgi:hypothetical protein
MWQAAVTEAVELMSKPNVTRDEIEAAMTFVPTVTAPD